MGKAYFIMAMISLLTMLSCHQQSNSGKAETLQEESVFGDSLRFEIFVAELDEENYNRHFAYADSIEQVYQLLLKELPQYQRAFDEEKTVWEKYMKAGEEVAHCISHGLESDYICGVLDQGVRLREVSIHNLYLYVSGKEISYSKTTFTPNMIADAYSEFIKVVGEYEYNKEEADYQEALRQEQDCWNEWLKCRESISRNLRDKKIKTIYDICTNQLLRIKLIQVKNQNSTIGPMGREAEECALEEDDPDSIILEYPGFEEFEKIYNRNRFGSE